MTRKESHTIACSSCKKTFPIVVQIDTDKITASSSLEVECPFCDTLLTIDLPGSISADAVVYRGTKKAD